MSCAGQIALRCVQRASAESSISISLQCPRQTCSSRCRERQPSQRALRCQVRQIAVSAGSEFERSSQQCHRTFRQTASDLQRRGFLFAVPGLVGATVLLRSQPVHASPAEQLLRGFTRPEVGTQQAVTMLLDAKGTLLELKRLADSPRGSDLRFHSRVLLPGMAKRLREVGMAAPIAAALATGTRNKETELSESYGGDAGAKGGAADPIYASIGRVVTISGRTIRYEAQYEPELAIGAIQSIDALLGQIPSDVLDKAQQARAARG